MNRAELADLIRNGENSGVEFKRDDVPPDRAAREFAALLNLEGGYVLLGLEDDGAVTGLAREAHLAEEWVMNIARNNVRPAVTPYWETIDWEEGLTVGVIHLPADSPDKPYKARRGTVWVTQMRVGTTSRDATDEEEMRLYQQAGRLPCDIKPVPGSTVADLDHRRLVDYFSNQRQQEVPTDSDEEGWHRLLINTDLAAEERGLAVPTVAALLLFAVQPSRLLPQAGITATAFVSPEKDYNARERSDLRGAAVSLKASTGETLEAGVIERAMEFVRRNSAPASHVEADGQRVDRSEYPVEAVREAIVNAVAHRDYTITVSDIELSMYPDRLEVISPGRLPNTVTVDKMRAGYRASRNQLIMDVLRDYRYCETSGLGVPRKIVRGMIEHNGTDPDLIEEDDRFVVRLWNAPGSH